MNTKNLREELKQLEDVRRGAGQRHKIDVVLMITILATMSGYILCPHLSRPNPNFFLFLSTMIP